MISQLPDDGDVGGGITSDSDSDEEQQKGSKKRKSGGKDSGGVYVPPKLSAVHYDGEDSKAERNRKQMERAKKRALRYVLLAAKCEKNQIWNCRSFLLLVCATGG